MKKSELKNCIRDIPDFPKKGIIFKDITTLLANKEAFRKSVDLLASKFKKKNVEQVVAVESRGFIFGATLANKLKAGFIPSEKKENSPTKQKP